MAQRIRRYGVIEKVEHLADGTIKVYGYASTADVDDQGETITAEAMKAAIPGYMKWGAVREMHQPIAAGTALEASVDDKGRTMIGVHVVDSAAVAKVETGVYKAFSIGAKVLARNATDKKIIEKVDWIETSLVDRPANPNAVITICKAAGAEDESDEPASEAPAAPVTEPEKPAAPVVEDVAKVASDAPADDVIAKVSAERDDLAAKFAAVTTERDDLATKVAAITTERDTAIAKATTLEATVAERDKAISKIHADLAEAVTVMKSKGILRVVEKSGDVPGGGQPKEEELDPNDPNTIKKMILSAHARPVIVKP